MPHPEFIPFIVTIVSIDQALSIYLVRYEGTLKIGDQFIFHVILASQSIDFHPQLFYLNRRQSTFAQLLLNLQTIAASSISVSSPCVFHPSKLELFSIFNLKWSIIIKKPMDLEAEQNIVKSIIYGNMTQSSCGLMRALCSAISSKDHIDKILLFLRNNQNFQKFNKFIYAFRLQQQPNQNHLFLTQDNNPIGQKFLEGYNDDNGLEGNGQKLLALLQKFNVRNVLVIVALRQKDSLRDFSSQNYMQIVKCAKDLLSSLYDKVVLSKGDQNPAQFEDQIEKIPIQPKEYVIPINFEKVERPRQNPNYVGREHIRKVDESSLKAQKQPQIAFLNHKIKQLAGILEDIIERFSESEDAQVKFAIKYDKNKKVVKVFNLLAKLFDCKTKEELLAQNMSTHLRSITSRNLTVNTIRSLNEELMSDRGLKAELVAKQNKICGVLMQFLEVLLKSYAFAKKLAMIQSQVEDKEDEQMQDQVQF